MALVRVSSGKADPRPALEGSLWSPPLFPLFLTLYPFPSNGAIGHLYMNIYIYIFFSFFFLKKMGGSFLFPGGRLCAIVIQISAVSQKEERAVVILSLTMV